MKLKKYNLEGLEIGEVELSDAVANAETNGQLIKDYITALRHNARQWSASTRGRSEVNHTKKKPHRQKGLGRARQGSLAAPQYRGGGRTFGPRPKFDQHVRINRKERRQAIRALLGEKAREGRMVVVEDFSLDEPSTKIIARFFKSLGFESRTLLLVDGAGEIAQATGFKHQAIFKSTRNIPKTECCLLGLVNGYNLLKSRDLILTESALSELNDSMEKA